ncbi:MAG: hypothetical protein ABF673_02615, partial [Acetobacter persici]
MKAFLPVTTRTLSAVTLASLLSTSAGAALAAPAPLTTTPDLRQVKKKASRPISAPPSTAPPTRPARGDDALTTG